LRRAFCHRAGSLGSAPPQGSQVSRFVQVPAAAQYSTSFRGCYRGPAVKRFVVKVIVAAFPFCRIEMADELELKERGVVMDSVTIIRIVCGVLFVIVLVLLVQRRKKVK